MVRVDTYSPCSTLNAYIYEQEETFNFSELHVGSVGDLYYHNGSAFLIPHSRFVTGVVAEVIEPFQPTKVLSRQPV